MSSTEKASDIYFTVFMMISLILFVLEILASSVALDDYKYSFYFYLDIVATLSIITDVQFLLDFVAVIFGMSKSSDDVNAVPGFMHIENEQDVEKAFEAFVTEVESWKSARSFVETLMGHFGDCPGVEQGIKATVQALF